MHPSKLFFIYVARNEEWVSRQKEDWDYVTSMTRFYRWWIKRNFDLDFNVEADILPVIPGRIFDRMSISYLARDHIERGKSVYHFYLANFKPFWTDCRTDGYSSDNFGMIYWKRLVSESSESKRARFYADINCTKLSHVLCHEILRMNGKKRNEYFDSIHDLWDHHINKELPYIYYNDQFRKVSKDNIYRFVTIDVNQIR